VLNISALIPSSTQGLPWTLSSPPPSWLSVSQTSGAGPALVTLRVEPGTPIGSVASLNFNTNPAFAAPSVEVNPLIVTVTVGQNTTALGAVLLSGGATVTNSGNNRNIYGGSEIYSSADNIITGQVAMVLARSGHTATLLKNGQVLVAGGLGGAAGSSSSTLASAELYSPQSNSFAAVGGAVTCPGAAGCMIAPRQLHSATRLLDGRVLIVGGTSDGSTPLGSAEIYDPAAGTFAATGALGTPRFSHTSTLLKNGDVLIAGGLGAAQNAPLTSAEIFHAASGTFSPAAGNLASPRLHAYCHTSERRKCPCGRRHWNGRYESRIV
jgi:hypothetical protein